MTVTLLVDEQNQNSSLKCDDGELYVLLLATSPLEDKSDTVPPNAQPSRLNGKTLSCSGYIRQIVLQQKQKNLAFQRPCTND
jgi:hypothetical protein